MTLILKQNIQFYILSRNRPDYLRVTLDSLLKQNHSLIKFEIIISDSSDNEDVYKMINEDYAHKNIRYIKRIGVTSHMGHTQLVVSELNSEYSVIFHDDDILHPDYMTVMSSFLSTNDAVAIGCNCINFKDDISDPKKFLDPKLRINNLSSPIIFNNEKDFLERYLPGNGGSAALPSYMYRTKYLKEVMLKFPFRLGKPNEPSHADALMLSSLLKYGMIHWIDKPLIYYRIHASNLSVVESIPERLVLLNYMKKKGVKKNSMKLQLFKVMFMKKWLLQQGNIKSNINSRRYRVIVLFFFLKTMKLLIRISFLKLVLKRLFK